MIQGQAQSPTAIVLSGPPGVGKTALGRALSKVMGRRAVDLDQVLEHRAGTSVSQLLARHGEARFRALEAEALATLPHRNSVLSLGGGTLTTRAGRRGAHAVGPVLGLRAPEPTLQRRLAHGPERPLLKDTELATLLEARRVTYRAVDREIDVGAELDANLTRLTQGLETISVDRATFGAQATRVVRGHDLSAATAGAVAAIGPERPVVLLLDRGVPLQIRQRYSASIEAVAPTLAIELEGGESVKRIERLHDCLEQAIAGGAGRQSVVVGIGGGALCDLAGFLASVLGRGAPLVLVPTTLLAQVDAAIGGKVAVNLDGGRNLAGAFHAAQTVLIDDGMLPSLDPAETRSGMAELFKIALISDRRFFDAVVQEKRPTPDLIGRAVRAKAAIVARDPYETGERRRLNLGHTLGHALETASGYRLRHGEAVAIGIAAAARFSNELGLLAAADADEIVNAIQSLGLPTTATPELLSRAEAHILNDKKGSARSISLITIHGVAKVAWMALSLTEASLGLVRNGGVR